VLVNEKEPHHGHGEALDSDRDQKTQQIATQPHEKELEPKLIVKPPQSPIAFDWVRIDAGEFSMGLDRSDRLETNDWEIPRSELFLPEFWIARTTVTVTQFAHFVKATGYKTTAEVTGKSYVSTGSKLQWIQDAYWEQPYGPGSNVNPKGDHPVTCVSWYDASAFCQWAGVHLPSEAEWEKAARGKTGFIYPWGHHQPNRSLCNFNANVRDTLPVGSFPDGASPYQVLDMAGNVWEWTRSLWGKDVSKPAYGYPYQGDDGREDLTAPDDVRRVVRGGSFSSIAWGVRCAVRDRLDPANRSVSTGFRVVVSPGL